jgi:hypothetical protein
MLCLYWDVKMGHGKRRYFSEFSGHFLSFLSLQLLLCEVECMIFSCVIKLCLVLSFTFLILSLFGI